MEKRIVYSLNRILLTRMDGTKVIIPLDKVQLFETNIEDDTTRFYFEDGNILDVKEDQWYIHSIISEYENDVEEIV